MFLLNPELQEAIGRYTDLIRRNEPLWEREPQFWAESDSRTLAMEFACASAAISDTDSHKIPWKTHFTKEEIDAYPWLGEFLANDVAMTEAFLRQRKGRLIALDPVYVNMSICRTRLHAEWRTSSDKGDETSIPPGVHGSTILAAWVRIVRDGMRYVEDAPEPDRRVFAWAAHDSLNCLRPFRDGNGRTARLIVLHVRRGLSLPPIMFERSHRTVHRARTRFFNEHILTPYIRATFKFGN